MRIGEAFQKAGLLDSEALDQVLQEQRRSHDRLGEVVLKMGLATHDQMIPVLAKYFDVPFLQLKTVYKDIKPEVTELIPKEMALQYRVVPVALEGDTLTLAVDDPLNILAIDKVRIKTGLKIKCVLAPTPAIMEAIDYNYHSLEKVQENIREYIAAQEEDIEPLEEDNLLQWANEQPVVQYVQSLIIQAVNAGASDVILQPKQRDVDLRLRIDGMLCPINPPPKSIMPAVSTRIKVLSNLDIAERRLPQDGRFRMRVGGREIDLRVSVFPTIYGESVVLRLLDTSQSVLSIDQLGFDARNAARFKELIQRPYGLILVTGPTGSGKTTTLYAALNEIKSSAKNIVTLEDPVEYRLGHIQQSQVNATIGFDFKRGLRSILRQDPDVIMIGEIRDTETAEIAIHAALTGHLVFATLHTNDAVGAAVRLINMGVEPYLITSSLIAVIAQRLIRQVCPRCKESLALDADLAQKLGLAVGQAYSRGKGCPHCFQLGYKGRQGIYELFIPDEKINQMILNRRFSEEIQEAARANGLVTLFDQGRAKLQAGVTTPEEVLRITHQRLEGAS